MVRVSSALLCTGLILSVISCRASFRDIQKANLLAAGDDLGARDNTVPVSDDAVPNFPILEKVKELPLEDSESYDCDGRVVIHEKGRDKNLDGTLQPTEVTEISTECRANIKEPTPTPTPSPTPAHCPNQSKDPSADCDDDASQSGT
jgi:hypothetical protein